MGPDRYWILTIKIVRMSISHNMRKRLISIARATAPAESHEWLELGQTALVEVTSEAEGHAIEDALLNDGSGGWRANGPGVQTIRLLFDQPQTIKIIRLVFREEECARTQEFVLRWLPNGSSIWRDIVRQQWNFSPPNTVQECEEYNSELVLADGLELTINPDISRGEARASLERLQLSVKSKALPQAGHQVF